MHKGWGSGGDDDFRCQSRDSLKMSAATITPISGVLPTCSPNLMPFHIEYSGSAPISTYFRVKPAPSRVGVPAGEPEGVKGGASTTTDGEDVIPSTEVANCVENAVHVDEEAVVVGQTPENSLYEEKGLPSLGRRVAGGAKRFVAAFRGRTVHGIQVELPEGYCGVVLRAGGEVNGSPVEVVREKAKTGRVKGKKLTRSSRKAMDIDDVEAYEDERTMGLGAGDGGSFRTLQPAETFKSFVLWQADYPVDEGRDEYYRSLTEWTTLSAQVLLRVYFIWFPSALPPAFTDTSI